MNERHILCPHDTAQCFLQNRFGHADVDPPPLQQEGARLRSGQIVEVAASRAPVHKVDGSTQEVEPIVFQAERKIKIGAAARERLIEPMYLLKRRTPHKQGNVLEEQALRRARQMPADPCGRILAGRPHLLVLQVLPQKLCVIGERTDGSDLFVQQKGLQELLQALCREDNALLQKEEHFA